MNMSYLEAWAKGIRGCYGTKRYEQTLNA